MSSVVTIRILSVDVLATSLWSSLTVAECSRSKSEVCLPLSYYIYIHYSLTIVHYIVKLNYYIYYTNYIPLSICIGWIIVECGSDATRAAR